MEKFWLFNRELYGICYKKWDEKKSHHYSRIRHWFPSLLHPTNPTIPLFTPGFHLLHLYHSLTYFALSIPISSRRHPRRAMRAVAVWTFHLRMRNGERYTLIGTYFDCFLIVVFEVSPCCKISTNFSAAPCVDVNIFPQNLVYVYVINFLG